MGGEECLSGVGGVAGLERMSLCVWCCMKEEY